MRDVPNFLSELESYLTPFAWKQFNVVLLPGIMTQEVSGMENPYLTIVQSPHPNMILHELSHSWFGNQVTCDSWPSYWINEAFAVFLERKMTQKLFGKDELEKEQKDGLNLLQGDLQKLGGTSFAALEPTIDAGTNPEKA